MEVNRTLWLLSVLFLLCLVAHANAQPVFWQRTARIDGGIVNAIASGRGNKLFAATTAGVFASIDDGTSWTVALRSIVTGTNDNAVIALSVDSVGNVYAATANGNVLRSTDDGAVWSDARTGIPARTTAIPNSLASSATQLAFATSEGVFVSDDRGDSWQPTSLTGRTARVVAYTPNGDLYALGAGLHRSTTSRSEWQRLDNGLGGRSGAVAVVPLSSDILLLTSSSGASYRSTDRGGSWAAMDSSFAAILPSAIARLQDGSLLAAGQAIARSTDEGISWSRVSLTSPFAPPVQLSITSAGHVFAATPLGTLMSRDTGKTWAMRNAGIDAISVAALADGAHPGSLYAVSHGAVHYSSDHGTSWTTVSSMNVDGSLEPTAIESIAAHRDGTVLIAYDREHRRPLVVRSTDRGATWAPADASLYPSINTVAYSRGGVAYALPETINALFRSTDHGRTWTRSAVGESHPTSVAFDGHRNIFVGSFRGAYWSRDGGVVWEELGDRLTDSLAYLSVPSLAPLDNGIVVAGGSFGKIYRLRPGQSRWELMSGGETGNAALEVVAAPNGSLFAGGRDAMLRSNDTAVTWHSTHEGLEYGHVRDVHISESGFLYVATHGGGVYRSIERQDMRGSSSSQDVPARRLSIACLPNPASRAATLAFVNPASGHIRITVSSTTGNRVTIVLDEQRPAGPNVVHFDAVGMPSGHYHVRIQSDGEVAVTPFFVAR